MYTPSKAIRYAHRWAYGRNPRYLDFEGIGGDCTNFVSQCLYAGCGVMNFTPVMGWYYRTADDRTPSWTGVEYLYNFLTKNKGVGPYGEVGPLADTRPGDVLQLRFDKPYFSHSLLVVETGVSPEPDNILIATHSFNADNRPLDSYQYEACRLIHIAGSRNPGGP